MTGDAAGAGRRTGLFRLEVAAVGREADGVVSIRLRAPDGSALPRWRPGAHADFVLPSGDVRQYSLCGDPARVDQWRIAVLLEPESRGGSRSAHADLAPGVVIEAREPRNHFALEASPGYLFIAGGIGITPIIAMIAEAERAGARWSLVYGGRSRRSMAFVDELDRFGDRVRIVPQDEAGLIDLDALLSTPSPGTLVYCCGPEALLEAVATRCGAWPADSLHVERFSPRADALETGERRAFTVRLAGSGLSVEVAADRSILEALEEVGIYVASSCREGTCGSCETAVVAGTPEHHDSLLTEAERAAGDTMMICVGRAVSASLTLDL